jgi:DNA-binding NarL/FixJ family response regulator
LHPDVVLLDVMLPEADGFEVARLLVVDEVGPAVVLTSTRSAATYARRLASTSARGFLPKHELSGAALTRVLDGEPVGS